MITWRGNIEATNLSPLSDVEVEIKMKYLVNLITELEWRRLWGNKTETEDARSRVYKDTRNEIKKLSALYSRKEHLLAKDTHLFESRMISIERLKILHEKDKHVTDVVLAVHRRLGRVNNIGFKKAYRRVLYALVVQALCKMLSRDVVVVFRRSDMRLGTSVITKAQQKFKEITGMTVHITISTERYLPLESCGGVDIYTSNGRQIVNNSLAMRLDLILQKVCPMIRIALYGINATRVFFDLSRMSGSPTLFDYNMFLTGPEDKEITFSEAQSDKIMWSNRHQAYHYHRKPTNEHCIMLAEMKV